MLARALFVATLLGGLAGLSRPAYAASTLVESGATTEWRYLDDGQRAPAGWMEPAFDDAGWRTGRAPLGFGEPDVTTTVRFGGNPNAKAITTWFRHEFPVGDASAFAQLMLFLRVDDGAVVYLNGREIGRINMPAGNVGPETLAPIAIGGDAEQEYHALKISRASLVTGRNLLAIEVHQGDAASSDLFLDVRLRAYASGESPAPEDNPRTAAEEKNPIATAMAALQRGDFAKGMGILGSMPAEHPRFLGAMLQGGRLLAETTANRPDLALQLVARAYEKAPDNQEVAMAWARTQLLARVNLSVPFVPRAHLAQIPDEWKWIVDGPHFDDRSKRFSRAQIEADLDYLETMVANGYSYADRRGADWRGAFDAVRASLADQTPLNTFTLRLQRAFTVFGDPHSYLNPPVNIYRRGYLPFLPIDRPGARVLAVRTDRTDFVDPDHPYLVALDGRAIEDWLRVAAWDVPFCSPQYRWLQTVQGLRWLNYLRSSLNLPDSPEVKVTLVSEDGSETRELTLAVSEKFPRSNWPKLPSPTVHDGIGYLQVDEMLSDQKFLDGLDAAMRGFRETRALIIDARGNRGGSQDALRTLMPYFLPPGEPMRIVNVAAYRIPAKFSHALPREGFLPEYRYLYPASASVWTDAQRRQIVEFLAGFQPNWKVDDTLFSTWHVMGIAHETNPKAYHYDRPVIVLSDAGAFSAGDNFLGAMKNAPQVTLLGTTSGGGSGRMANYVLPNTKLALTLCQMASFRSNGALYDGAGVEPDVVLEAQPRDQLVNHGDTVLEAAIARLKAQTQPKTRRRPARRRRLACR